MKQNGTFVVGDSEHKTRGITRPIYILSCAVVIIVLAACIATVIVVVRNTDKENSSAECISNGSEQSSQSGDHQSESIISENAIKEGDVVQRQTKLGIIEGKIAETSLGTMVEQYLGIPFAEPPVGGNRFKDPQPITRSYTGGVYRAFKFGDACTQPVNEGNNAAAANFKIQAEISEDCLNLNVWVPHPRREGRAVMVWIYGGSFNAGANSILGYSGATLSTYGDVIVVSMNYRLQALGFIALDIPGQSPGNQGIKDQQMALRWVQDNIANFGGDPNQVTIFGESAGAGSVGVHLMAPSSGDLFNRAILQSGSPLADWVAMPMESAQYYTDLLADTLNCSAEVSKAECLRNVPATELYETAAGLPMRNIVENLIWSPIVDGEFIPDDPDVLLNTGMFNQKDVLTGVTKDEGSMFAAVFLPPGVTDYNATWWAFTPAALYQTGASQPDELLRIYKPDDTSSYEGVFLSFSEMLSDQTFICPATRFAKEYSEYGAKVYFYYLTYRTPSSPWPEIFGVAHAADLQWVFGHPLWSETVEYTKAEKEFSKSFMSMWANFAKYGHPTLPDEVEWKSSSFKIPSYLEFKGPNDLSYYPNQVIREEICKLWA